MYIHIYDSCAPLSHTSRGPLGKDAGALGDMGEKYIIIISSSSSIYTYIYIYIYIYIIIIMIIIISSSIIIIILYYITVNYYRCL